MGPSTSVGTHEVVWWIHGPWLGPAPPPAPLERINIETLHVFAMSNSQTEPLKDLHGRLGKALRHGG